MFYNIFALFGESLKNGMDGELADAGSLFMKKGLRDAFEPFHRIGGSQHEMRAVIILPQKKSLANIPLEN